jgi:hypothetical protein
MLSPILTSAFPEADALPGKASSAHLNQRSLQMLVQQSAVIFSGRVLRVESSPITSSQGSIAVTFIVEVAIRGVTPGQFLARFFLDSPRSLLVQPGERLVVFLHQPNAAGITSGVGGACGLLIRRGGDRVDLEPLALCTPLSSASSSSSNLRSETIPFSNLLPPAVDDLGEESMPTANFLKVIRGLADQPGILEQQSDDLVIKPVLPSRNESAIDY